MKKIVYTPGQKLGTCTFLEEVPTTGKERKAYFRCVCGNTFIANIQSVKRETTRSCGCRPTCCTPDHGQYKTRLYSIWNSMKERCLNPNNSGYSLYGAKGITVCTSWLSFKEFKNWADRAGYDLDLSLDRIDPTKDYCPENCRWVNLFTQAQNRNKNKNNSTGYKGVSYCSSTNNYKASIGYFNKQKTLGRFNTAEEAAIAYNNFVIANNMEHRLNEILTNTGPTSPD